VVLPADVAVQILKAVEADPTLEITISLETRRVTVPALGVDVEFPLDDSTRHRFMNGLDDIGITLQNEADITAFEATRPSWLPATR